MESYTINPTSQNYKMQLMKADEVADYLNVSISFVYRLLQTGTIPTVWLGRARRVRAMDLDAYIMQNIHTQADDG